MTSPAPTEEDLRGDQDEGLQEGAELHAQHARLLGLVMLTPARRHGQQQARTTP